MNIAIAVTAFIIGFFVILLWAFVESDTFHKSLTEDQRIEMEKNECKHNGGVDETKQFCKECGEYVG